jgi:NADPH:quinone reductase-like Zn-dependent oxidoreductase
MNILLHFNISYLLYEIMKSIQIKRYGSSDVMEVNDTASVPSLPPGKILVNVNAAGVNPIDWKIREGYMQQMIQLQFPSTLGMDFSGVIKQIGENMPSDFKQGNEVYGQASVLRGGSGAFAELALVDKDTIAHKPKTLDHLQSAALPLVGVSAWQAIVENIGLSKGQKILIHGGAGGIGSIAMQLAKHLGAYVATTASTNDKQFVQELGADQVVDYTTEKFEDTIHDYDAVFDTVAGDTYKKSFKVLKKGSGIIVSMLEQPNSELMNQYGVKALFQFTQVNRERLTKLAEWVDQNNIKVNVDKTFSLDQAAKALDYQKDVHPRGKVVLTV